MSSRKPASLTDAFERALGAILARVSASVNGIAIAYSGGLDSSTLLHLAKAYSSVHGIPLLAFHVHHGLSPHADEWLRHCEGECARLGIPFDAKRVTLANRNGDGVEQAARHGRYAALGELCRAHRVPLLLTAHHLDDQAETVLLQLLRGSGVAGLSGMELCNCAPDLLGDDNLSIARPLLEVSRGEIERFVREQNIAFVDDESNADSRYARNALRHNVMPSMERFFPGYQERFARTAQHLRATRRLLDEVAEQDLLTCVDGDCIDIEKLRRLSSDRIDNLLRHWFARHRVRMPSTAWLAEMRSQLLQAKEDALVRVIHADCEIRRHRGRIFLTPRVDDNALDLPPATFQWSGECAIHFPAFGGVLHFVAAEEGVDASWLRGRELQLRLRSGGERLKLAPNRPTRSLKHHFQALNIPAWERLRLPVLTADGRLLFAAGVGMNCSGVPIVKSEAIRLCWEKDSI